MTVATPSVVAIGARTLSIDDVVAIADGAEVALDEVGLERIRRGRAVVDAAVAGPDPVYGLNTGLGHMRDERVDPELLREYQVGTVLSHAGGIGDRLPTRIVRAAMAVRVAGIALGGSGASEGVARTLVAMLNRGVHPVVPATGSVGAADLMHMAAIGAVAIGHGRAEVDGTELDGADALARAGIDPLVLEPKDGLALISANGVAVGRAALTVDHARAVVDVADVVVALSLEAIGGNPSVVEPAAAAAKPVAGQAVAARRIRALLDGSARCSAGGPTSVQDPLSFRVAPQVHGACREVLRFVEDAVVTELGAMDDNPLVAVEEGRLVSNGNFEPIALALAFDALRPALAHVGQLSERRMNHLWARFFAAGDVFSAAGIVGLRDAPVGPLVRYAAATRYAALRGLAGPASLDVPSLDDGQEDHATNAPETVARTDDALEALEDLLAIELAMDDGVIRAVGGESGLGRGTAATLEVLRAVLAGQRGQPAPVVHAAIRAALGAILTVAGEAAAEAAVAHHGGKEAVRDADPHATR